MHQQHDPSLVEYPHGRGYGHDYMRGGEVLGGYGYAERAEYAATRGERAEIHGKSEQRNAESVEQDSSP